MAQMNPATYAVGIQAQLASVVSPVPVYALFNRNYASQPKFLTWALRNVHQTVYTGPVQGVKGIDRPVFQVSVFSQSLQEGFVLANQVIQALHGYAGQFGGNSGFYASKCDVDWLYNSYDNDIGLHQIFLDCTLDVPT